MRKKADIHTAQPSGALRREGAEYALKTLPWTFNRMMANTSPAGQNSRALNIAKGVVAQGLFRELMIESGRKVAEQEKSHRNSDLFDLRVQGGNHEVLLDLKSFNIYTNYKIKGRPDFSLDYLLECQSYDGPLWTKFFPMLVPHTQIQQASKDAYVFALGASRDFRKLELKDEKAENVFAVFPFGPWLPFLTSSKLALLREENSNEFYLQVQVKADTQPKEKSEIHFVGESQGVTVTRSVRANGAPVKVGPFSLLASIYTESKQLLSGLEEIRVSISNQGYSEKVLNSARRNINEPPQEPLVYSRKDFCNLILPEDYTVHFLGWITKPDFRKASRSHRAWVWPKDSIDKFSNQAWATFSDRDKKDLAKVEEDMEFKGGVGALKTTGLGNGAACYFYPNMYGGGVREMNFYCLLNDLSPLSILGK